MSRVSFFATFISMSDKVVSLITILVGIFLVLLPSLYLENFVRTLLKNFGIRVETRQINLTKLVVEIIRFTGAILIGVGLILFFVLPYYSLL